jgi:putative transposase
MSQVWSYDFVFGACANDQQIKCLTVVDEYARECLAIDVAGSIRSRRVIDVLSKLITQRAYRDICGQITCQNLFQRYCVMDC